MPASPQAAPATLSSPAPGYCAEPARTPTTPRVYFCASGSGRGTSAATSAAWSEVTSAAGRSRPMSTRVTEPQARLAGSTRWATLWVPKVTVTAASTWGPSRRPSSTDTPLGTSTATIGTPGDLGERGHRLRLQPRASADPDDPVDHHLGARRAGTGDPAAGPPECSQTRRMGLAEQHRVDVAAATGQQGPGVQRVSAVVTGSDQEPHPAPVRRPEQIDDCRCQPGRRPGHQRPLREGCHQRGLGRPHLFHRVRASHPAKLATRLVLTPQTADPARVDGQASPAARVANGS